MKNIIRHGDISLHPVKETRGEVIKHEGSYVVAEGETTGHKHVISVKNPADLIIKKDLSGRLYFELLSEGSIAHEEHKTIKIPPGIYKENREQEYNYFQLASQRVID